MAWQKCQIAILRRGDLNHPPLEIQDKTRICLSCNRSINAETRDPVREPGVRVRNV